MGRKTAACVLLFAHGLRDVPVDTHVGRVATRLALLRPGARSDEQHDAMLALTPPGAELELHVNLLRHGRRTCHAQRPACGGVRAAADVPGAAGVRGSGRERRRGLAWVPTRAPKGDGPDHTAGPAEVSTHACGCAGW